MQSGPPVIRAVLFFTFNFTIARGMPSSRMQAMASAARLTAASMAFLSSPVKVPSTQSAIS